MKTICFALWALISTFSFMAAAAEPVWTLRNIWPEAQELNTVAHGNGMYVAVGLGGSVLTSSNGVAWNVQNSGSPSYILGAAFGNGRWVLVGEGMDGYGTVLTSSNGLDWAQVPMETINGLGGVIFAGGLFVAVGSLGTILTSDDGLAWTPRNSGTFQRLNAIEYGGGTFVAAGGGGTIVTSVTGGSWTPRSGAPGDFDSVAYDEERRLFVVSSGGGHGLVSTLPSTEVFNWLTVPMSFSSVTFGNGVFLARSENDILVSTNGTSWTLGNGPRDWRARHIRFGNGLFFLVGDQGTIYTSVDGNTWIDRTLPYSGYGLVDVGYGAGRFVAIGGNRSLNASLMMISSDGSTWTGPLMHSNVNLSAIAYGNGRFVAVADGGASLASSNGLDWTALPGALQFRGVAFGNGVFVAAGTYSRYFYTSSDGADWTERYFSEDYFTTLTYINGQFVGLFQGGVFATSTDGIQWTRQQSASAPWMFDVTFGNGFYFAAGFGIHRSVNLSDWTSEALDPYEAALSIEYAGGMLVAAGETGPRNTPLILTSANGNDWTRASLPAGLNMASLQRIAYGNNTFVVVGGRGVILQSEPVIAPALEIKKAAGASEVGVRFFGQTGESYVLQGSESLASDGWTDILNFTLEGPTTNIAIPFRMDVDQQYFRAVRP